jgi:hypothetical protein
VPALSKVLSARARIEWQGAAWRCIEAVRLYAATHGKLPASLGDIKEVPVPPDPVTGRPFEYTCDGTKATLTLTRRPGESSGCASCSVYVPSYELTLRR